MRRFRDRLEDILEAIGRIESEGAHGRGAFDADPKVQVWMLHYIQVIGEAVRGCGDQLSALDPSIPWAQVVGMRHILVHDYFGIDLDEVWAVVERDIPKLRASVETILERTNFSQD